MGMSVSLKYVHELPEKGDKDTIYLYRGSEWIYLDHWTALGLSDPEELETATEELPKEQRTKCPNCGAPLTHGHCSYCGCY